MTYKYNSTRISEIMREDESALDDLCEVEDVIAKIKEIDKNIVFYKKQKKSRTQLLNESIAELEKNKDKLKNIIKMTLDQHEEESLSFPHVGVVKKKSGSSTWNIKNEDALMDKLRELLTEEELEDVIVIKPKLAKKEVDKFLEKWSKGGTWPDGIENLVEYETSPDNIAITMDKGLNPSPEDHGGNFFKEDHSVDESTSLDDVLGEVTEDDL